MTAALVTLAFIVGICVGIVLDDAWDIFRASRSDKKEKTVSLPEEPQSIPEEDEDKSSKTVFSTNTLATLLIACCLALLGVGISLIISRNATEQYSKCTAQWQQEFSIAYTARSDAASEVSQTVDRIMLSVAALKPNDPASTEEFKAALQQYLQVRAKQDKERQTNPLPPLPKVLCGDR